MKQYVKLWATFNWLEIVSTGDFCEDGNEPVLCIQQLIIIVWKECKRKLPSSKVMSRSGRNETDNGKLKTVRAPFEIRKRHLPYKSQNMTAWVNTIGTTVWSRKTIPQYSYSRSPLIRTLVIRIGWAFRVNIFLLTILLNFFTIYIFPPTVK
jgi:hypothetical protein